MAKKALSPISRALLSSQISPKESPLAYGVGSVSLFIGLPKERSAEENRVALRPSSVALLCSVGHKVCIESGAGEGIGYADKDYVKAGACVVSSAEEVFASDIVLKVNPPSLKEIALMKPQSTLISALLMVDRELRYIQALNAKKITAIAFELIKDEHSSFPVVRAMGEIAGSLVILIASEYMSSYNGGVGLMVGGITGLPLTKVLILGSGTVATHAARVAIGLGADIKVFDWELHRLQRFQSGFSRIIYTSLMDKSALRTELKTTDVLIIALRKNPYYTGYVLTKDMVASMKPGTILVDISIDQGDLVETSHLTSHKKPTYVAEDVLHYCVPNIASRVPKTASMALSNIFAPLLLEMGERGGIYQIITQKKGFMESVYTYKGYLTNIELAKRLNMDYKDMNLLIF